MGIIIIIIIYLFIYLFNIRRSKTGTNHVDIEHAIYSSSNNRKNRNIYIYTLWKNKIKVCIVSYIRLITEYDEQ